MIVGVLALEFVLQVRGFPRVEEIQRGVEVLHPHHSGWRPVAGGRRLRRRHRQRCHARREHRDTRAIRSAQHGHVADRNMFDVAILEGGKVGHPQQRHKIIIVRRSGARLVQDSEERFDVRRLEAALHGQRPQSITIQQPRQSVGTALRIEIHGATFPMERRFLDLNLERIRDVPYFAERGTRLLDCGRPGGIVRQIQLDGTKRLRKGAQRILNRRYRVRRRGRFVPTCCHTSGSVN